MIIRDNQGRILVIERAGYPQAIALPAGHVDKDENFREAAVRETKEEVGIEILDQAIAFQAKIDNPCQREKGTHHLWQVYTATDWKGQAKAGSDVKSCYWITIEELKKIANRTEYFMEKYNIPYEKVGRLTKAIFGDPNNPQTDIEWLEQMGLEPVWYYMLKKIGII